MPLSDRGTFQRCVGTENSHKYMLDYVVQYVNHYAGLNKWAHVQSLAGHESTGTVVETLDGDLRDTLLQLMQSQDELVVFLMADHGMRYGQWYKEQGGATEHKLPMLFVLASASLLERIPYSLDVLTHNSNRLVSKLDIGRTLRHLAYLPYLSYRRDSVLYSQSKAAGLSVSLLLEKISNARSCSDVLIPPFYCACMEFYATSKESLFVRALASEVIRQVNTLTSTSKMTSLPVCRSVTLGTVTEVSFLKASLKQHIYRLTVSIKEHPIARFEACVIVSNARLIPQLPSEGYELQLAHMSARHLLQVLYIRRTDSYSGVCEEVCKASGLLGSLCICAPLERIDFYQPKVLDGLRSSYSLTLADKGVDCNYHCSLKGALCSEVGLALANTCKEIWAIAGCMACGEGQSQALPGLSNSKCLKGTQTNCEAADPEVQRVCACEV